MACAFLENRNKSWPLAASCPDNASLIPPDAPVTTASFFFVLQKLPAAGFVSDSTSGSSFIGKVEQLRMYILYSVQIRLKRDVSVSRWSVIQLKVFFCHYNRKMGDKRDKILLNGTLLQFFYDLICICLNIVFG
jgi:hypothetical protein